MLTPGLAYPCAKQVPTNANTTEIRRLLLTMLLTWSSNIEQFGQNYALRKKGFLMDGNAETLSTLTFHKGTQSTFTLFFTAKCSSNMF